MLGRVSECTRLESKLDAVLVEVTTALCPAREGPAQRGHSCRTPVATTSEPGAAAGQHADTMRRMSAPATDTVIVLLYSNSADVRTQVRTAVGRRPAPDSPRIDWLECATSAELVEQMDIGGLDLAILDGEGEVGEVGDVVGHRHRREHYRLTVLDEAGSRRLLGQSPRLEFQLTAREFTFDVLHQIALF